MYLWVWMGRVELPWGWLCGSQFTRATLASQANSIIQDIRRIVRNEKKVINRLHRRIFLDTVRRGRMSMCVCMCWACSGLGFRFRAERL